MAVKTSDLISMYQGQSERSIKLVFEIAREKSPCILFFDEIDSLCMSRSDDNGQGLRGVISELLVQMDGLSDNNNGLLLVAATNIPWSMDSAIRRRFQKRIYIGMPDYDARAELFKNGLSKNRHEIAQNDFETLSSMSDGYSGSDIKNVIREALMMSIFKLMKAKNFKVISELSVLIYFFTFFSHFFFSSAAER